MEENRLELQVRKQIDIMLTTRSNLLSMMALWDQFVNTNINEDDKSLIMEPLEDSISALEKDLGDQARQLVTFLVARNMDARSRDVEDNDNFNDRQISVLYELLYGMAKEYFLSTSPIVYDFIWEDSWKWLKHIKNAISIQDIQTKQLKEAVLGQFVSKIDLDKDKPKIVYSV